MEKQKLGVKMSLPYKEAVAYMEDLLESLKSGRIVVQSGEDFVTLTPSDNVGIEVEAKAKKGKQKFGFELTLAEGSATDLTISDKEPAIPMPPAGEIVLADEEKSAVVKKEPAEVPVKAAPVKKASAKKASAKKSAAKKPAAKKPTGGTKADS